MGLLLLAAGCRLGFDPREEPGDTSAPYPMAVLTDQPLAYFRFDESGGQARSVVGTYAGTYEGDFVFGEPGASDPLDTSVRFDGSSTRIELGDVFRFAGSAAYSFEVWIRPRDVASTRFVLFRRALATADGYQFYIGDTYTIFSREAVSEFGYVGMGAPSLDTWTHLVVTYSGALAILYMNGVEVQRNGGDVSDPIGDEAGSFSIGDSAPGQFYKFDGLIDELAVYDHELPPARVLAHFQAARPQ